MYTFTYLLEITRSKLLGTLSRSIAIGARLTVRASDPYLPFIRLSCFGTQITGYRIFLWFVQRVCQNSSICSTLQFIRLRDHYKFILVKRNVLISFTHIL